MNHIEAIDAGLTARKSHNEIARKVFLTYPTKVFIGDEERQFEILNEVSIYLRVPITCVHVAGSAKFGQSFHKNTLFNPGMSDLDLAIIDSQLFSALVEIGLNLSKGYSDGSIFPVRQGISTQEEYLRNLTRGIFRPDLMPIGEDRADWANFFGKLSDKHTDIFKSINGAVYLSQGCFECKQRSAIKARANREII
jgi:hypothetical protein